MRIVQLIDSLEAGGAERMAVNLANGLAKQVEFSGLVCTRKEGLLLAQIRAEVNYFFMAKKSALDLTALFRIRKYCLSYNVTHVHAHATSFFTAFLLRLLLPKLKIIYHHHYGLSANLNQRPPHLLRLCSTLFAGILVVNEPLKKWAQEKLACTNVRYLPNFVSPTSSTELVAPLAGIEGKRILCLANLRQEKNHQLLLSVAELLSQSHSDWTFHLVGQDFNDEYASQLKNQIIEKVVDQHVFIYGTRADIAPIANSCSIGILTSIAEGLPLALLEYGYYGLPVVVTNVGGIAALVDHQKEGFVVPSGSVDLFYKSLVELIENQNLRLSFGQALQAKIQQNYSEESVINAFLKWSKE